MKQYVIDHINKFPVEESHYSRNKNPYKKYLSPLLNQTKKHQMYLEQCDQINCPDIFKITLSSYSKIFTTEFNLSFGPPKSDTCSTCDAGKSNEEHLENYHAALEAMKLDKERAKESQNIIFIIWIYNRRCHFQN